MTARASRPIALVSGGNRGIGFEVCRQLAEASFDVVLGSRDVAKGEQAAALLRAGGLSVVACRLDVTEAGSVAAARDWLEAERGVLDVLVNNAAANYDTWQDVLTADLVAVAETIDTNTMGPWRTTLAFLPLLRRSAHPRVVNVSSAAGAMESQTGATPGYSISKLALNGLTRMLANRLRPDGILVNAVCPGWVATEMGGAGGRPVHEGAAGVVWAARLPDDGPSGGFFRDGRPLRF